MTSNETPQLGLMDQGWAASETDDFEAMQASLATIRLADELGFDSAWIGEHHHKRSDSAYWGRIPAVEVFLGYAAAQTSRIALGTGVRILSSTPAQRTAEEMCVLSALTGGRVDFGVGLGHNQHGLKTGEEKAALFRRLLDELVAQLRNDPALEAPPLSPTSPVDIVKRISAAARDEPTIRHIAKRGINLVVGQAELPNVQAEYIRHFHAAGGTGQTRGVRLVFVGATHEQAIADSTAAAELYFSQMSQGGYYKQAVDKGLLPAVPESHEVMLEHMNYIVGTPDKVAAKLNDYLAVTGVDRVDIMAKIPRIAPEALARSITLLQQEVRPQLVRTVRQSQAASAVA